MMFAQVDCDGLLEISRDPIVDETREAKCSRRWGAKATYWTSAIQLLDDHPGRHLMPWSAYKVSSWPRLTKHEGTTFLMGPKMKVSSWPRQWPVCSNHYQPLESDSLTECCFSEVSKNQMWLPMALLSVHVSAVVNGSMPLVPWFSGAVGSATGLSLRGYPWLATWLATAIYRPWWGILQTLQIAKLRADEMCLNAVPWWGHFEAENH